MEHFNIRTITSWIYKIIVLNGLFILFSLPVVTLGASSAAAFTTARLMKENGSDASVRIFVGAFRKNFKESTKAWLVLLAVLGVTIFNLMYSSHQGTMGSLLWIFQWPLLFQILVVMIYVFPIISRYDVKAMRAVKSAWIIGNRNLLLTLGVVGGILIGVEIGRYVPAINIFILAGAIHVLIDRVLDVALKRIQLDQQVEA